MIKRIQNQKITVIIPTMNRDKLLARFFKYYFRNCGVKTDFVVVNSNLNRKRISDEMWESVVATGSNITEIIVRPPYGLGKSRQIGFREAIKMGNEIIFQTDDDCYIGPLAIEKMMAPLLQRKKFWAIGTMYPAKYFMRGFEVDEVRFHLGCIAVCWATKLSVINRIGGIDPRLKIREDNEFAAKIWANGGWCGVVHAKVNHKRNQPVEAGERNVPALDSPEGLKAGRIIANRYPGVFKHSKGRMYKQIEYPQKNFRLTEEFKLYEKI